MNKAQKSEAVAELKEKFVKANAAFFADYKGLTVEQVTNLRKQLRAQNVNVKVVKNNLARLAVKEANLGSDAEKLLDTVAGPTMIAFAYGDPVLVAKTIQKFSQDHEVFNVKESLLGSQRVVPAQVEELSKLPAREVLLAKMLGSLNAPVSNFVGVLAAVPRSFVQVLAAVADKKK